VTVRLTRNAIQAVMDLAIINSYLNQDKNLL
jgi:hypothetical protein